MGTGTSQHILNTSSNLLGFCLIVVSSLHFSNYSQKTIIDEVMTGVAVALIFSCFFSFISIRTSDEQKEIRFEKTAEILFLVALIGIAAMLIFLFVNSFKS